MATDLPTAANMIDIDNAIKVLALAIILGTAGTITAFFSMVKWYLPAVMKRRDEQRQIENDAMKKELENKSEAAAVDLERERLLPQMFEQNRVMSNTTITLAQSFNTTMQQRTEQDAITSAALTANTRQLTVNTERLEETTEKLEAVEKKVDLFHDRLAKVFPRDKSIDELFGEIKEVIAGAKQVVDERREHDSKPIPTIKADITFHTPKDEPPDSENGLEKAS